MSNESLPPFRTLQTWDYADQCTVFTHLFEHCSTLNEILSKILIDKTNNCSEYEQWIEVVRTTLLDIVQNDPQDPRLASIIAAHPRLGEKKTNLSIHSLKEQKSLSSGGGDSPEVLEQLRTLNEEYEAAFPGLRYVVFVNGRRRDIIMDNMRQRIARGDFTCEEIEALNAMCDIAQDRLQKLINGATN